MKHRKTFRIDKLFGLATLVCLLVITLMVYNDFFKDTVSEGNVIGKETESETRTSGYLNDNKNVESKGASSKAVVCLNLVVLIHQKVERIQVCRHQAGRKRI